MRPSTASLVTPRPSGYPAMPRRTAQGFSLLAILLMMAILGMLTLGAMSSSIVQERMVGNTRDRHVALQAAEAGLRDAELDIETNIDGNSGFTEACTAGLCIPPSDTASGPQSAPRWQSVAWAGSARTYGSRTLAAALLGPDNVALAQQPMYVIERLPSLPQVSGESAGFGGGWSNSPTVRARAYRISVKASGIRATTVVMLQSVYVKQ